MKSKKIFIIIGLVISIVSFAFLFMYYKSNNNRLTIYTSKDSYAYQYAQKNMINTYDVSDSHYNLFHRISEDFKYNVEKDGLILTKYEGNSKELILPTTYENKKIIEIGKDAFPLSVKKVFLPQSVKTIDVDTFKNIEILCYRGEQCESFKSNEELHVTILDDVDRYIYNENKLEFTYNIINVNEVELTNYLDNYETIIIPETINGYKVTSINFDGKGVTSIFIPKTVNNININITSKLINTCFIFSSIIITASLLIYLIIVAITKANDSIEKAYIYSTSIIYLSIISYIVAILRNNPFEYGKYTLYSLVTTIVYIVISYVISLIIKKNNKFDKDIKSKSNFIKEMLLIINDYNLDELKEIEEAIKYSDPVSISDVKEIELNIKNELKNISKENIKDKVSTLKKLINKRNTIIKNNK